MYINKVDEVLDKILDDFYNSIIIKQKEIKKIKGEPNFVKYQSDFNKILLNYTETIDRSEINRVIQNEDNLLLIVEIIKRYLAYYIFMYVGFFYKDKKELFVNNVIEFSKNQPNFNFKVENFFNSESNGNIVRFYNLIKNIVTLTNLDSPKVAALTKKPEMKETIDFLNEFGQEFVSQNFKLENLSNNVDEQAHNIIKTIILNELYLKVDKKEVYQILEAAEKEQSVYTFIDIVLPKTDFIDYNSIENALSEKDVERGLATEIYDFIIANEDLEKSKERSIEEKILDLFNNGILTPISEDFLLYHKDSERYEKVNVSDQNKKKKEDTKIRYIVSKIDNVAEYFSPSTKNNPDLKRSIEKNFYLPLSERRAVLVNNNEEIRIINKLLNQGRKSIENNEYYNDLINYRTYPYVNFKDFRKYGFGIPLNQTIDVIRSISFPDQNGSSSSNKQMQLRTGSNNLAINVVGLAIVSNSDPLNCLSQNDFYDIRKLGYNKGGERIKFTNGYTGILRLIKEVFFKRRKPNTAIFWFFDLEADKIQLSKYDQVTKMTESENIKIIIANIYDQILRMIFAKLQSIIDKKEYISFYEFKKLIASAEERFFAIPKESELYHELENYVYSDKYFKSEKKYDNNEDRFYGLSGDIIKLPKAKKPEREKVPTIIIKYQEVEEEEEQTLGAEALGAICQHNIAWEKISAIRRKFPNEFTRLLHEFIRQYVIENYEDDFVCTSCGTLINIKKYIPSGAYNEEGQFVSFYSPLEVPLEDIPEYEKYKTTIRNLEKLLERIASIGNIQFLIGRSNTTKLALKRIVRDTVDLLLLHNEMLKKIYKERNEKIISIYGITRELTNLFVFELDNNIFVYSSKDKDFKKPIKRNNIIIYLLFLTILEYTDSQILFTTGDRTCNYYLFSKYGFQLFNNLKIIKNDKRELTSIQNYKLLCYLIFYYSCLVTKYNMWYSEKTSETDKPKKFNPWIQKIIIYTFVDFINSILEMYSRKKKKYEYLYEIIAVKFFQKLNTFYGNEVVLNKIKTIEESKVTVEDKKTKYKLAKIKPILLTEDFQIGQYSGIWLWSKCIIPKLFPKLSTERPTRYYMINNVTNCEEGTFHKWEVEGKTMVCRICGKFLDKLELDDALTDLILRNYRYIILRKLAERYCASGPLHNFIFDTKLKCDVCQKCKSINSKDLTKEQLEELEQNVNKMQEYHEDSHIKKREQQEKRLREKQKNIKNIINDLKNNYGKTKQHKDDFFHFVDILLNLIDSQIGKNVNINNQNIYTKYDTYIIDHDHNGFPIDKPLILNEKDNQFHYRKNHPFYNKDVIFYTNYRLQIDVFYDAITNLLVGFKERNKDFEYARRRNVYLKINYSIKNRLKLLGYPSKYINISSKISSLKQKLAHVKMEDKDQFIMKEILSELIRDRIDKLKRIIRYIQKYIYRVKYNYKEAPPESDDEDLKNLDKFIEKYQAILKNLVVRNREQKDKVFRDWKIMKNNLFFQELDNKTVNIDTSSRILSSEDISYYDYHGNLILYYIVQELVKLINYNDNRVNKVNICYFIIDIINRLFGLFNIEHLFSNFEIKRFNYIISSQQYVYDIEEKGHGLEGQTEGFYGEYKDIDDTEDPEAIEQKEIDLEEQEALDIETTEDFEIDYAENVNYN